MCFELMNIVINYFYEISELPIISVTARDAHGYPDKSG